MKIHFLSDSPKSNSGFANVTKNLALGLRKLGYNVSLSGFQTIYPEFYNGIPVLPMATNIDEISQVQNNIMKVNPDIVIYISDAYTDARKFLNVFPRTLTYCPVEGSGIPNHMVANLNKVAEHGKVIAQCSYGYNEMKKAGINVTKWIYHGFDDKVFYPIDDKEIESESKYCYYRTEQGQMSTDLKLIYDRGCHNCKFNSNEQISCPFYKEETVTISKYMHGKDGEKGNWAQIEGIPISNLRYQIKGKKFMYLFVGANHMIRKKIERLLVAYSILIGESKQLSDRIILHLHTNPVALTGIDLLEVANRLGIQNSISFSYGSWSENGLNILYNIADCHVSATSSEGFSLPHLESMAVGLPQISPDCTSMTELIGNDKDSTKNRGLLAKISEQYMIQDLSYRSLVDERDLALKMKEMYTNKNLRDKCGDNALKFAQTYIWDKICDEWNQLLNDMK